MLCHVSLLAVLQVGFAPLEIRSLLWSQGAVFDAVSNTLLLPFFTTIDLINTRMSRINHAWARACVLLCSGRAQENCPAYCEDEE